MRLLDNLVWGCRTSSIPVLFYHGIEEWEIRKFEEYFKGIDTQLNGFIPNFDIQYMNIINFPDEQIIYNLFDREANKVLFLLMKHIFDSGYLEKHLKDFPETGRKYFDSEEGIGFLKVILIYLSTTNEIETEKIIKIIDKITKDGGKLAMTTAMKWREEGIKEGIKDGKMETAKKMVKKGIV